MAYKLTTVLSLIACAGLFTACSGADDPVDPDVSTPPVTPSSSETPPRQDPSPTPSGDELCVGTYKYTTGSVRWPYHYTWSVTVNPDSTVDFTFINDGMKPTTMGEETGITPDDDTLRQFCHAVRTLTPEDIPPGGPIISWDFDFGEGETSDSQTYRPAEELAIELVGRDTYDAAMAKNDEYIEANE